jgi:hypothetical protein
MGGTRTGATGFKDARGTALGNTIAWALSKVVVGCPTSVGGLFALML